MTKIATNSNRSFRTSVTASMLITMLTHYLVNSKLPELSAIVLETTTVCVSNSPLTVNSLPMDRCKTHPLTTTLEGLQDPRPAITRSLPTVMVAGLQLHRKTLLEAMATLSSSRPLTTLMVKTLTSSSSPANNHSVVHLTTRERQLQPTASRTRTVVTEHQLNNHPMAPATNTLQSQHRTPSTLTT